MDRTPSRLLSSSAATPLSTASSHSNHTFVMPASSKSRKISTSPYKPQIITTVGARPACLVNASVTYVGENQMYAFGGFDQYTDEVYNHVLRLNLQTKQWNLVDNYGDIPGVRMGHTATLWQGHKLLVYGGENEHRSYLSDMIIFDISTATWTQPTIVGPAPKGRARHSAVIHDDKLWISGGMTGHSNETLSDVCFLDLKSWTWSRSWKFVPRVDHTLWVWSGRLWAFGGMNSEMQHCAELWWIDFCGNTNTAFSSSVVRDVSSSTWKQPSAQAVHLFGPSAHMANSASIHSVSSNSRIMPGSVSMMTFISSPNLAPQSHGHHFHVYSSGYLLDFATPDSMASNESSLSALDLETLRWHKLADGRDLFNPNYRWHYCAMNDNGTHTWLLGCPPESSAARSDQQEELLSDVLHIDLVKLGIIGNNLHSEVARSANAGPTSDSIDASPLSAMGADLARMFDQPPDTGSGTDFIVTGEAEEAVSDANGADADTETARPIHVHKLILQARWPHFARLYSSQMLEFHTKKLALPESYATVRAFLYYLYSDSIAPTANGPSLANVAGMLVMANMYDMPRLRGLCVDRLSKELDVEHAAIVWERAATAGEDWLRRRAARFCMVHWGRIVRTDAFRALSQNSIVELCEETDEEGRVLGGAELEVVGNLHGAGYGGMSGFGGGGGGGRLGFGAVAGAPVRRRAGHANSHAGVVALTEDDVDDEDEEEAEMDVS